MSGGYLLGLIGISMASLFALAGLVMNFQVWRAAQRARPGERVPSGMPLLPGVVGSVTLFFLIPQLHGRLGIDVPWPFFWILLPLFLDLQGLGGLILALAGFGRGAEPDTAVDVASDDGRGVAEGEVRARAAIGCLLGTAVGDALGLPGEGLSKRRLQRWYPSLDGYRLVFGHGMCSDDTDHACMVAQSITASAGDARRFASSLGWRLRFWLAGLPAGVGFGTLRAILKLWLFFPPQFSGVRSAGNGPAMRSALLGVCFDDDAALAMHVSACTGITHTDPRAECGALAVALAARASMRAEAAETFLAQLRLLTRAYGAAGEAMVDLARRAVESADKGEATPEFAASIGCAHAVSGYMYHSVPVALHAWRAHPDDLPAALGAVIRCGGDTDTVGAITGAIVGAGVGKAGIPAPLLERLWDWPRGVAWMEVAARRAAGAASSGVRTTPVYFSPLRALARNAFFLCVVLAHGFRRLAPPY